MEQNFRTLGFPSAIILDPEYMKLKNLFFLSIFHWVIQLVSRFGFKVIKTKEMFKCRGNIHSHTVGKYVMHSKQPICE
jgi:hypothetical protein